jgi:hypothetical protein
VAIEAVNLWTEVLIRLVLHFRLSEEQEREAVALVASVAGRSRVPSNLQGLANMQALATQGSRKALLAGLIEGVEQLEPTPQKLRLLAILSHFFDDEVAVPLELELHSILQDIPAKLANSALATSSGYLSAKTLASLIAKSGAATSGLADSLPPGDADGHKSGSGLRAALWQSETTARLDGMIDGLMLVGPSLRQSRAKPILELLESANDSIVSAYGVLRLVHIPDLNLSDALLEHSCQISGVHERWRSIANSYRDASVGAREAGFESIQEIHYADLQLILLALVAPYIPDSLLDAARVRADSLASDIALWTALSKVRRADSVHKPSLRSFGSGNGVGELAAAVGAFLSERSCGKTPTSQAGELAQAILRLPTSRLRGIDYALQKFSADVARNSAPRRRTQSDDPWLLATNGTFAEIAACIWDAADSSTGEFFRMLQMLSPRLSETAPGSEVLDDTRHAAGEVRRWFGMGSGRGTTPG